MPEWNSEASLMRVATIETSGDSVEDVVARGKLKELVGLFLDLPPQQQEGLLLRAAGAGWIEEYDSDAIRELAARPEYTGAYGFYDTAEPPEDPTALREVDS